MRLLIVDDSAVLQRLFKVLLVSKGHSVVTAFNAEEARASWANADYDLVLLDIWLEPAAPVVVAADSSEEDHGAVGLVLIREIRLDPTLRSMKVVAVTGDSSPGDRERFLAAGFDAYMSKPIDPKTFVQTLEEIARAPRRVS